MKHEVKLSFSLLAALTLSAFADDNVRHFYSADADEANKIWLNPEQIGNDDVFILHDGVILEFGPESGTNIKCRGFRGDGKVCKWGAGEVTVKSSGTGNSLDDGVEFEIGAGTLRLSGASLGDCSILVDEDSVLKLRETLAVNGEAVMSAPEGGSVDSDATTKLVINDGGACDFDCDFTGSAYPAISGAGSYRHKGSDVLFPASYGLCVHYLRFDGDEALDDGALPLRRGAESPYSADSQHYRDTDRRQAVMLNGKTTMYGETAKLGDGDFSIAVRAKTQKQANTALLSFGYRNSSPFGLRTDADGKVQLVGWSNRVVAFQSAFADVADPTSRYHVYVLTYSKDENRMRFYADGVLVDGSYEYLKGEGNTYAYRFGGPAIGGGDLADVVSSTECCLDEFRAYRGTALTAAQIAALQAELHVWPSPTYTATLGENTNWGDIVWNEGLYTVDADTAVTVTLENGAVLSVPGTADAIPNFTVKGAGTVQMSAGSEGAITVQSGVTLRLVVSAALVASGYTASDATLEEGASIVFADSSGNVLQSGGRTLAASGVVWTNAGNDDSWTNDENWSTGSQPASGSHVVIEIAKDTTLAVPSQISLGSLTVRGSGVLTLSGAALAFGELVVGEGTTLDYTLPWDFPAPVSGAGRLVKRGGNTLTLENAPNGKAVEGGIVIEVAEGGVCVGDGTAEAGVGDVAFVVGENAALDNNGDMAFFGSVMVSNATDKTVFSGGGRNATAIRSVGGSFAKGGAGVLTLPAKFTGAVASLEIQDGTVDFYVGEGMDYSISGPVEALGHVRKSGPGTLTHAVGGTYSAGIEVAAGEMVVSGAESLVAGVSGAGTLVSESALLYIVCNKPAEGHESDNVFTNEYTVDGGTIKAASGEVWLGKRNLNDGARIKDGTFILDGGTVTGYGWTRINGTMTFDTRKPTTIYDDRGANQSITTYGGFEGRLVKKGAERLTVDANPGDSDNSVRMSVEIQEGQMAFRMHKSYKHMIRCASILGAGELYLDGLVTNRTENLVIGNLAVAEGGMLADRSFSLTGTLRPLAQLADLGQTFSFADGARVDLSGLSAPFGGSGVFFTPASAGAVVTVDVGDRTDCLDVGDYLCRLGAKPAMRFALAGTGTKVSIRKARAVDDGIRLFGVELVIVVR